MITMFRPGSNSASIQLSQRFVEIPDISTSRGYNRKTAEGSVRGTGFEPDPDVPGRSLRSLPGLRLVGLKSGGADTTLTFVRVGMRGTGFEPEGDVPARRFAPARAATPRARIRTCSFTPAASLRSAASVQCAGPDSNRRTPTGQRPKRCAVGRAWLPARTRRFPERANESDGATRETDL